MGLGRKAQLGTASLKQSDMSNETQAMRHKQSDTSNQTQAIRHKESQLILACTQNTSSACQALHYVPLRASTDQFCYVLVIEQSSVVFATVHVWSCVMALPAMSCTPSCQACLVQPSDWLHLQRHTEAVDVENTCSICDLPSHDVIVQQLPALIGYAS